MNNTYDVIVIGAGVLGCFAARNLTRYQMNIAIIEQREDVCTGISRANTSIIYSGYETKPGTLKTELCVNANRFFEELCEELDVRFTRCGSIMLCFGERGEKVLRQKFEQGIQNGVPGIRLLSREEILQMEPNLSKEITMGLYAPTTGVVNPWELGIAAWENAAANGCKTFFSTKVSNISKENDGYCITTNSGEFKARGIVNCSGLFSDEIHDLLTPSSVRIVTSNADYFIMDTKTKGHVKRIIFHEPEEKGKGLTVVPTVDNNLLLGPSDEPTTDKDTFATSQKGLDFIRDLSNKVLPGLDLQYIIRSFGAKRPNPYYLEYDDNGNSHYSKKSISSFIIQESESDPCFISLIGIKTPGLTCSNELGKIVAEKLADRLELNSENHNYNPIRKAPPRLRELSHVQRNALILNNPSYGKIVCRCSDISEGEILDAIDRGASTLDAVKRRAGTGLGRCQGSFCTHKVIEILSRELNTESSNIEKDGPGSWMIGR